MRPSVILGHNTNLRVGQSLFHVQTEDRGLPSAVIETVVFAVGRVVYRCRSSYQGLVGQEGWQEQLRGRLEAQHQAVLQGLRDGTLALRASSSIAVELLNPASWLAAGMVTLELRVTAVPDGSPVAEAEVRAVMEHAGNRSECIARTDAHGHASLRFSLPDLGPGDAELVIRASAPAGTDEIRYTVRPKARASAAREPASTADDGPAPATGP
ncbi:MAG: carboxypeptidase-like regulatory domain-containing protein [Acidobacteriia bacterium]|jgi:hypothetical protein|nr:carboxypeptidase-like regulatory domain-containing protein [Terriglobia bacterium]